MGNVYPLAARPGGWSDYIDLHFRVNNNFNPFVFCDDFHFITLLWCVFFRDETTIEPYHYIRNIVYLPLFNVIKSLFLTKKFSFFDTSYTFLCLSKVSVIHFFITYLVKLRKEYGWWKYSTLSESVIRNRWGFVSIYIWKLNNKPEVNMKTKNIFIFAIIICLCFLAYVHDNYNICGFPRCDTYSRTELRYKLFPLFKGL